MVDSVDYYFTNSLAPTTKHTYSSSQKQFLSFCSRHNLSPLPASELTLCGFAAELADNGLKHQSIKVYLSGIRNLHISQGSPPPALDSLPCLQLVLRVIQRHQANTGVWKRTHLPITLHILAALHQHWAATLPLHNASMLWVASCVCFFGFLRAGEICAPEDLRVFNPHVHLTTSNIELNHPSQPTIAQIRIKR